jgi:hypothetical protein
MVMWFSGKNGLGPTSVTSAPLHSHWFVKWLGQTAFVYGKVSSFDFLALGAPTPKFLTYVPLGTAHGSVNGNVVSINVPLSSVGLTAGDKIEHVTAYSLVEAPDPTLNDWADQSKTFSYVVGTPLASQHLADGYVQVSTDGFVTSQLATLNGANNTWIAPLTSVSSSTVCARQVLAKDLYTPVWDDVQAGPVACFALPLSPTTTSIESSSNPSSDGQAVTFTARVTFTEPGTPGGIVTFSSDGTAIGTGTLDGTARASFTTSALAIGTHAITAVYSGDANFAGSASLALTQTILAAPPLNITALGPDSVCQGGPDFMLTVDGGPFDAGSKVQLDGVPQETSFVGTTRVTALIHGSDIVTSGVKPVRVVDSTNNLSNIVFLSVTADGAAPVVTPPDAITVAQTICNATNGGATGSTSAALAAFLSGGSGVDACTATPARLTAQVSGADAGNATVFSAGTSTVTFRFRDNAGNVGVATSTVTVRAFGDLDETGDVTATDLVLLANYLVGNVTPGVAPFTAPLASSDVNGDAKIDAVDIVIVANYLVGNIDCLAR